VVNLVLNEMSVLGSAYIYVEYNTDENKLASEFELRGAVCSVALSALVFAVFFKFVCVPEHRQTFWSTRTGWQSSQGYFLDNLDYAKRIFVFKRNRIHWRSTEAEVMAWTHANWARWEEGEPEWFTERIISIEPDEFVPKKGLERLRSEMKRRGSARKPSVYINPYNDP